MKDYGRLLVALVLLIAFAVLARTHQTIALAMLIGGSTIMILRNLGTRRDGELSAYTVFNRDFEALPGQLRAEHFEAQIRGGGVAQPAAAAAAAEGDAAHMHE